MVESDVFHCAVEVRSLLLPSLYLPIAVNCWTAPGATLTAPGVTCSELSDGATGGGGLFVLLDEPPEPQAAMARLSETIMRRFESFVMVLSPTCWCKSILLGNFPFSAS